ncbi:MAG: hypothetical protein LBD32_00600 [Cytophagales bacterium]|jgi:hypothetical protein|nr:hypothetical protein [Cytophagales bacterium]
MKLVMIKKDFKFWFLKNVQMQIDKNKTMGIIILGQKKNFARKIPLTKEIVKREIL